MEKDRVSYLDNLRISLVALVICHHINAAYGAPGGWYYIVHEPGGVVTEILAIMFAAVTQAFFMSSFFMISAYFTVPAYDHKGAWHFARRRLVRLGIPLLFYYYVLSVVLKFFVFWFRGRLDEGFFSFFSNRFLHDTDPGPLWFALALLIFEAVYIVFRKTTQQIGWAPRTCKLPGDRQILLFILGIGLFTFLLRQLLSLNFFVFHLRPAFFPLYVSMFIFGAIAYRSGWFRLLTEQQANRWFRIALATFVIAPFLVALNAVLGYDEYKFWGGFNWQSYAYAAWEPFLCVGINMKLIVLYRDRFNWTTPLTTRLAKSSYTAYIIHAFVVVFASYLFTFFSVGRLPEILLMWPVAVISCFLIADVLRRVPLLNRVL